MTLSDLQHWTWDQAQPFSLDMAEGRLDAQKILRHLPGKRLVVSGLWQGAAVIAKIFFDDQKAAGRHELSLLETLSEQSLRVPEVKSFLEQGSHTLLLMSPVDGVELGDLLQDDADMALVNALLDTIWALYQAGWIQSDLHLGNFLVQQDDAIVCLDAGAVKPVPERASSVALADNLALMCAQAPLLLQAMLMEQCRQFMQRHGVEQHDFERRCRSALQRRMLQADRKWQRNCSAVRVESIPDGTLYSDRDGGEESGLWRSYCQSPGSLPLLKAGSRIHVYANDNWVVKHYRDTGLKARLKQKLKCSRGMISWRQGWLWALLGVPTPRPVMLAEFTRGARAGSSVVVFPRLAGLPLSQLMEQQRLRAEALADTVRQWLDRFLWAGIKHGDMKAQNILVDDRDHISFIDLDDAGFNVWAKRAEVKNRKDRLRFEKNWEQFLT